MELRYKDITEKIIRASFEVHKFLGNGFQEVIYQRALAYEMSKAGLEFAQEIEQEIFYKELPEPIGTRRADFVVERKVLVELKAIIQLEDIHLAQALNCSNRQILLKKFKSVSPQSKYLSGTPKRTFETPQAQGRPLRHLRHCPVLAALHRWPPLSLLKLCEKMNLLLLIRRAICPEYVVKPQIRFAIITYRPGIPGVIGLCLSCNQSPTVATNIVLFKDGQNTFERIVETARHIFGAKNRPVESLKFDDSALHFFRRFIVMEGNDIRVFQHEPVEGLYFFFTPLSYPDTCSKWLSGINFTGPGKCFA